MKIENKSKRREEKRKHREEQNENGIRTMSELEKFAITYARRCFPRFLEILNRTGWLVDFFLLSAINNGWKCSWEDPTK